jgi:hypothetical protein
MSTRDAIAAALSSVDSVTGQPTQPDVVVPGVGWPQWTSAAVDAYCTLRSTWHVIVALPNPDLFTALDAADPLVDLVWAALLDVGEVALAEPVTIKIADPAAAGQDVPGLQFTLYTSGDRTWPSPNPNSARAR